MNTSSVTPFFLDGTRGRIYCLSIEAINPPQRIPPVLFIPPFAEEMNKSRHLFRSLAQLLVESGVNSVLFDFFGTGDSEGDFSDATWDSWIEDLSLLHNWLVQDANSRISIVTLRSGALLAVDFIQKFSPRIDKLVFLAPVVKGENYLSQFLRLRIAAEMAESKSGKATVNSLKEKLQSGESVEIAGYSLSPSLAQGMIDCAIKETSLLGQSIGTINWIELLAEETRPVPVVNKQVVEQLAAASLPITLHKFCGPAFWSATELVELPELLESIRDLFQRR